MFVIFGVRELRTQRRDLLLGLPHYCGDPKILPMGSTFLFIRTRIQAMAVYI